MANMNYCRFQNTLDDLKDCLDALIEIDGDLSQLSTSEALAAKELLRVCAQFGQFGS